MSYTSKIIVENPVIPSKTVSVNKVIRNDTSVCHPRAYAAKLSASHHTFTQMEYFRALPYERITKRISVNQIAIEYTLQYTPFIA